MLGKSFKNYTTRLTLHHEFSNQSINQSIIHKQKKIFIHSFFRSLWKVPYVHYIRTGVMRGTFVFTSSYGTYVELSYRSSTYGINHNTYVHPVVYYSIIVPNVVFGNKYRGLCLFSKLKWIKKQLYLYAVHTYCTLLYKKKDLYSYTVEEQVRR